MDLTEGMLWGRKGIYSILGLQLVMPVCFSKMKYISITLRFFMWFWKIIVNFEGKFRKPSIQKLRNGARTERKREQAQRVRSRSLRGNPTAVHIPRVRFVFLHISTIIFNIAWKISKLWIHISFSKSKPECLSVHPLWSISLHYPIDYPHQIYCWGPFRNTYHRWCSPGRGR